MRKPSVTGVESLRISRSQRRLPEGLRHHEKSDRFLDRPAVLNKTRCEEIEQLRMRRYFAESAKIIYGTDQTTAEKMIPNPVHHDPRCQRIGGTRHLVRQF